MGDTIVRCQNLSCKAGYHYLLRDINWTVETGQHWAIFGLNGSGKTTLLSIIAGYQAYTHGQLEVLGQSYHSTNIFALRRQIGWVSSSFFDKYLTKESALNIVLSGLSGSLGLVGSPIRGSDVHRAKALLKALNLADKINYPFTILSKGERQNVLIARALLANPKILILDEPSTGLDILAKEHMLHTVCMLAQQTEITILYVTHYVEELLPIFQNTLLLKNGRVYAKGQTSDLFTSERLSSFLGSPVVSQRRQNGTYQVQVPIESHICNILL